MKWRRVEKEKTPAPRSGTYKEWKEILAEEAEYRCVYCAIHEAAFGGTRNFHVEHYRPKARFPRLENSFGNLFYACPVCNVFKGDDWPAEPTEEMDTVGYADPSRIDYRTVFSTNAGDGIVSGTCRVANYMVKRLYLNRPQLILDRRTEVVREGLKEAYRAAEVDVSRLMTRGGDRKAAALLGELALWLASTGSLLAELGNVRPYEPGDVRRGGE